MRRMKRLLLLDGYRHKYLERSPSAVNTRTGGATSNVGTAVRAFLL